MKHHTRTSRPSPIQKAVIPVAGLGTRFLPITKAIPKEMLPIIDKPIIQYIVEEALDSGIQEVILVNGRNKHSIEDYFDTAYEIEDILKQKNKIKELSTLQTLSSYPGICSVRQKQALGLGHAILCAKPIIGNAPFAVLLGDDVILSQEQPALAQLIDAYQNTKKTQIAIMEVDKKEIHKYGAIQDFKPYTEQSIHIHSLIEKPTASKTSMAIIGRYIFSPTLWPILGSLAPNESGEIQLTDALTQLIQTEGLMGYRFSGTRVDGGDRLGFLELNLLEALRRPELKQDARHLLSRLLAAHQP